MPVHVETMMVTTSQELPGYRIVRNYGIVRGIIVRSRVGSSSTDFSLWIFCRSAGEKPHRLKPVLPKRLPENFASQ